jgi:hypothetical protein
MMSKVEINGKTYEIKATVGVLRSIKNRFGYDLLASDMVDWGKFLHNSQECFEVCCGFIGMWSDDEMQLIADVCEGRHIALMIAGIKDALVNFTQGRGDVETSAALEKIWKTAMESRAQLAKKITETDVTGAISTEMNSLDLAQNLKEELHRRLHKPS